MCASFLLLIFTAFTIFYGFIYVVAVGCMLISFNFTGHSVVPRHEALQLAVRMDMDLVEVEYCTMHFQCHSEVKSFYSFTSFQVSWHCCSSRFMHPIGNAFFYVGTNCALCPLPTCIIKQCPKCIILLDHDTAVSHTVVHFDQEIACKEAKENHHLYIMGVVYMYCY